jgi:hypothetical protein
MGTWFLNINHPTHTLSISALEEWMQKLLSDIDLSRSAPVAAFIELEAVACSYFQEWNRRPSEGDSSAKSSSS